jgi:hypothetical protein
MECFVCGKEACVVIETQDGRIQQNNWTNRFFKALCKKHFEELLQ